VAAHDLVLRVAVVDGDDRIEVDCQVEPFASMTDMPPDHPAHVVLVPGDLNAEASRQLELTPGVAGTCQVMSTGDRPLGDLLRRAANAADPDDALRAITVLRGELDRLERDHVTCARVAGSSWSQIASALSITRQAAQKRHRGATPSASGPVPTRTVLVTAPARMAVRLGRQEARAMGSDVVGSEHLLLGVMRSGDHHAVQVLHDVGISLDEARVAAQPTLVDGVSPDARVGRDGISGYARSVLEQSLREALARGEGYIGVEHLLLALLREDEGGAARTLSQLGVDPDHVRERLACAPKGPRA
jgi:hypothetical protein